MRTIVALVILAFILLRIQQYTAKSLAQLSNINADQSQNNINTLKIQNLALTKHQNNNLLYQLKSDHAKQIDANIFSLDTITALYQGYANMPINILAARGIIDKTTQTLQLTNATIQNHTYLLKTQNIYLDLISASLTAKGKVRFCSDDLNISSDQCFILKNSKQIICKGNVQADISFSGF